MSRRRSTKPVRITIALFATFILLHTTGAFASLTDPLVRGALSLAAPFYRVGAALTATAPDDLLTDEERAALTKEADTLRLENTKLRNALEEVDELRAAVEYQERVTDEHVSARVITERSGTFRGFTIDRGSDDGIRVGAPVLATDGVLLGKVSSVYRRTSRVRSLTDANSRLAVTIRNGSDTLGVLEGQRGISMTISLIPQSEALSPGDPVVTAGSDTDIRRGFPVGIIEKVNRATNDPFQTATIAPFESANQPMFVQVVMSAEDDASDSL